MKPARFREVRKYNCESVDTRLIEQAASNLKIKIVETYDTLIKLRISLNFWSFGEKVNVYLGTIENCLIIDITSTCVWFTQIVDWGKNQRNVLFLFDEIDKLIGDKCESETCIICNGCDYLLVGTQADLCPECGRVYSSKDRGSQRETATFRNAAFFAAIITGIEVGVCLIADQFGHSGFFSGVFFGKYGVVGLLLFNLFAIFSVVGLSRIVKRYFTKRD